MQIPIVTGLLADNYNLLKGEASKAAYQGIAIALFTILVATSVSCYLNTGEISVLGLLQTQKNNPVLWIIDLLPFVFGFLGQYSSTMIAMKAGAMVLDQTKDLRARAEELERQNAFNSAHNPLTKLPNRDSFYEHINQAITTARNTGATTPQFSIVQIEIENYKDIYDALGKNSGDIIIRQLVERLLEMRQSKDQFSQLENNILAVMLSEGNDTQRAESFVKDVQKAMESPFLIDRLYIGINMVFGIAKYPDNGENAAALVQRAGNALHIAQNTSKGYAFFQKSTEEYSAVQLCLISDLRHAIVKGGLELFYQPQIALKSGNVCGAEAWLRWKHPEHGYIPPHEVIPMAERNRIFQLTQWVLRRAFLDCSKWHEQGLDMVVSVNLSAKDLLNPDLPSYISSIAASTLTRPEWVMLEINESTFMSEAESAQKVMDKLRHMGYRFTLDNYGTGASSLAYLVDLPISGIKIDRSYTDKINQKENVATIVKTTINLAHELGLTITANGLETEEALAKLNSFGCDMAQGYFFTKPMPAADINKWLATTQRKVVSTPL